MFFSTHLGTFDWVVGGGGGGGGGDEAEAGRQESSPPPPGVGGASLSTMVPFYTCFFLCEFACLPSVLEEPCRCEALVFHPWGWTVACRCLLLFKGGQRFIGVKIGM